MPVVTPYNQMVDDATWLKENFEIRWNLPVNLGADIQHATMPKNCHFNVSFEKEYEKEDTNVSFSGQIFSIDEVKTPEYFFNNFNRLVNSFDKEFKKETNSVIKEQAQFIFDDVVAHFAQLPFNNNAVEISTDSLKLSLLFANETLLVVSKPFDTLADVLKEDVIFSVFINNKLIASDVLEKTTLVKGFNEFISM